ncbi:hypothetical protein B0H14DRAFT_3651102 [Mycena olivaceomarginata]|nr:hypothetical protein B0H14DRAFT_3651102 [Mycena olivaceomarginata]
MSAKLILLALLIRAPLLSNATRFGRRRRSSASVGVSSNPLPPNIGTDIASITPQLEYPLGDLRQLDSLFTSVTDTVRTLLGTFDDLAKKLVGGVLGQTVSESDIRSGAASTTSAGQVYDASQGVLRRLAQLTTEVNVITSAIQKCPTKPDNLAPLQETLDNLEKKLWIFVSRIARKCGSPPEEGHDLILTFQTRSQGSRPHRHRGHRQLHLEHHYLSRTLDQKLSILWGFIKTHLQSKTLIFLSSYKQVRFVCETFCKLHAVLFATDVAARGLDFLRVDWVLQVDAPEDAETYVHPEEEGMKAALARKGVEVQRIKAKMSKDPEIKYLGQRAFVSYLCSIHLHKDKAVFNLAELLAERFAESLGLPGAPKIKFLSKRGWEPDEEEDEDEDEPAKKPGAVRTKYDRMFERKNQNVLSAHYSKLIEGDGDDDDEEEFITPKRADHELDGGEVGVDEAADMSKRKQRLMASKAKRALLTGGLGKKLIFDEEGKPHEIVEEEGRWFAEGEKGKIQEANVRDKEEAKEKKREKKRKRKEREKAASALPFEAGVMGGGLMVADADDDGYVEPEFDLPTSDSDDDREVWAPPPPTKRSKTTHTDIGPRAVEDDEELALRLLRQRRISGGRRRIFGVVLPEEVEKSIIDIENLFKEIESFFGGLEAENAWERFVRQDLHKSQVAEYGRLLDEAMMQFSINLELSIYRLHTESAAADEKRDAAIHRLHMESAAADEKKHAAIHRLHMESAAADEKRHAAVLTVSQMSESERLIAVSIRRQDHLGLPLSEGVNSSSSSSSSFSSSSSSSSPPPLLLLLLLQVNPGPEAIPTTNHIIVVLVHHSPPKTAPHIDAHRLELRLHHW